MDTIRTLIVDDEPLARENLRIRLRDVPDVEVVGECGNGRDAINAIAAQKPDLVFLDIRMPDMDGFAVLERIEPESQPVVVFVTAYDRFALEAFRVHALDYLLKPFDEERFAETLESCRQRVTEVRRLSREDTAGGPRHLPKARSRCPLRGQATRTWIGSSSRAAGACSSCASTRSTGSRPAATTSTCTPARSPGCCAEPCTRWRRGSISAPSRG